jgi:hypothetical protein
MDIDIKGLTPHPSLLSHRMISDSVRHRKMQGVNHRPLASRDLVEDGGDGDGDEMGQSQTGLGSPQRVGCLYRHHHPAAASRIS